jgi:hypothetical protein
MFWSYTVKCAMRVNVCVRERARERERDAMFGNLLASLDVW